MVTEEIFVLVLTGTASSALCHPMTSSYLTWAEPVLGGCLGCAVTQEVEEFLLAESAFNRTMESLLLEKTSKIINPNL